MPTGQSDMCSSSVETSSSDDSRRCQVRPVKLTWTGSKHRFLQSVLCLKDGCRLTPALFTHGFFILRLLNLDWLVISSVCKMQQKRGCGLERRGSFRLPILEGSCIVSQSRCVHYAEREAKLDTCKDKGHVEEATKVPLR